MRTLLAATLVVAALGTACSSSSTPASTTSRPAGTTTTLQFPGATIDPTRVPNPSAMNQRIGLGDSWQMTVTKASRNDSTLTVELELYNGTDASIMVPDLTTLFTARDRLFGADVPASRATPVPPVVPSATSAKVTLEFAKFPQDAKQPTLLLRGAKLNGSLDATVLLQIS